MDKYKEEAKKRAEDTEKAIMYFISSHSREATDGYTMCYEQPVLPDLEMGDDFVNRVKSWLTVVEKWIKENDKKFKIAQNGYYKYK